MMDGLRSPDLERIAGLRQGLLDNPPSGRYEDDDPRWREIAELQARVELAPRGPEVLYGLEDQVELDLSVEEALERRFDVLPLSRSPRPSGCSCGGGKPIDVEGQAERVLEGLLERLDEDHGDPGRLHENEITPRMRAAARGFLREVALEYRSWVYEPTGEQVAVNVREWREERLRE